MTSPATIPAGRSDLRSGLTGAEGPTVTGSGMWPGTSDSATASKESSSRTPTWASWRPGERPGAGEIRRCLS